MRWGLSFQMDQFNDVLSEWRMIDSAGYSIPQSNTSEVELFEGRTYKAYRGMGSIGAMQQGSKDRYFQDGVQKSSKLIPEGIEGRVAYKGTMKTILHQLTGGLKSSMGYVGCKDINQMKTKTRFIKISSSAKQESHVHDVTIVKEPPNYQPR